MTTRTTIRKSRATTAYSLLSAIARLALAEPRRIDMNHWLLRTSHYHKASRGFPACGTVGCIGGWVNMLTDTMNDANRHDRAVELLGLTSDQGDQLFYPPDLLAEASHEENGGKGLSQTATHAKHVVAHIRAFQKAHAAQLKAKAV